MSLNTAMSAVEQKVPDLPHDLTIDDALEALHHYECQQNPAELAAMCEIVAGRHSLLEIGSNFGGTLWRMAKVLAPASKVVSLDLPEPAHKLIEPLVSLKANCQKVANMGHTVKLFVGDSHNPLLRKLVEAEGPFDFMFIDGDHSYEGVKKDWQDYSHLAKVVGFHDIAGGTDGCVRFWKELKAEIEGKHRYLEFDYPAQLPSTGTWMKLGIGIVFREE